MPIEVSWVDEQKTIISMAFQGVWTLEEFHTAVDEMYHLGIGMSHTTHYIIDLRASQASPAKLLSTGRHVDNKKHPKMGLSVIVGANPFMKAMLVMAEKLYLAGLNTRHCDTIEEAFTMIRAYDQKHAQKR